MAMKQTQTKLFDFSDVGLDFCAGSKNLFPDCFKKMLSLGYNVQTVSSVAVAGDQVTFTYGGAHGYVADRVLKVNSGTLAAINGGEFWIDSVTTNTLTFTLDDPPLSIANGFTTKIASLGWSLEYELENIQIYKFKQLDETDIYLRLCYQNNSSYRNSIAPCVGKSFDSETGFITDEHCLQETANLLTPHGGFKWEFGGQNNATANNYTYSQGYNAYGKGVIIGSLYHFISMHHSGSTAGFGRIVGILPTACHNYAQINYPVLLGEGAANPQNSNNNYQLSSGRAFLGGLRISFNVKADANRLFIIPQAYNSFLGSIDPFNVTTASPISIYDASTAQHYGFVAGGVYVCKYANNATSPSVNYQASPLKDHDVDLSSQCYVHHMAYGQNGDYAVFLAIPIEEIKYA